MSYCDDCFIDWKYKVLDNRYIIIHRLGYGSYASVWLAYDVNDIDKWVAIKIHNREDYQHGLKETKIYQNINSLKSNRLMTLIRNFDYVSDKDDEIHHCCVMDLLGNSLFGLLKIKCFNNGLPFDFIIKCIKQSLEGLNTMHKNNFIHGDVKPENILLDEISPEVTDIINKLNMQSYIKTLKKIKNPKYFETLIKYITTKLETSSNNHNKHHSNNSTNTNTDTDTDTDSDEPITISDSSDDESNNKLNNNESNNEFNFSNKNIKLTDMGSCVGPKTRKKKYIQTCYYKSPEILMKLGYDSKSDMWALGCTIYELLTGNILFDPDKYNGNQNKYHLFLISQKIGMFSPNMIQNSPKRDIFFSSDMLSIKGFNTFSQSSQKNIILSTHLKKILSDKLIDPTRANHLIDLIAKLLHIDQTKRLSADMALKHQLFT